MEAEIKSALDKLSERLDYQEHLHRNIDATPAGFIHGVVSNWPVIIVSVGMAVIVSIIVCKQLKP